MEPGILICAPNLGVRWFELLKRNGIPATGCVEQPQATVGKQAYQIRLREDDQGNYRINIEGICDFTLKSRIELITLASGGLCPTSLAAIEYDRIFVCPVGFYERWRSQFKVSQLNIEQLWTVENSVCGVDGELLTDSIRIRFMAGISYVDSAESLGEFVAFAPTPPILQRREYRKTLEAEMNRVQEMEGERCSLK